MKATLLLLTITVGLISCSPTPHNIDNNLEKQQPDTQIKNHVNEFFKKYKNEDAGKAVDYIFKNNSSVTGVENLKTKLDSTRAIIGNFTGFEQLTTRSAGKGLILLSYLAKHEIQPVRFTFIFYKPKNDWIIYKLNLDADVVEELEYTGKLYFTK